jgi:hypothetical protein
VIACNKFEPFFKIKYDYFLSFISEGKKLLHMPISRKNVQTLKDFVEVKTWTIDVKTEKKNELHS